MFLFPASCSFFRFLPPAYWCKSAESSRIYPCFAETWAAIRSTVAVCMHMWVIPLESRTWKRSMHMS